MVALAYNTAWNVLTTEALIQLLYIQPHDVLKRLLQPYPISEDNSYKEIVEIWLEYAKIRILDAQEAIRLAAEIQKTYYNSKHSKLPSYKKGDYISLRLDRHPILMRHNNLSQQKLPPCKVIEVLSNGQLVQLDLPMEMQSMHPVISIQQVEKVLNPTEDSWNRDYPRPPPIEEDDIYLVEIIGERTTKEGRKKYHICWIGYPLEQA